MELSPSPFAGGRCFGLPGYGRLCAGNTGHETEETNSKVDEIEVRIQIQLDGPEVPHAGKARDGHQGINRSKHQTKPPHPVRVLPEPGPKPDGAADEVKHVMGGREGEVEHFVAKESHHTDHHQNCSAQHDIDLCQRASHFSQATLPFARDSDSIAEFRGAYGSGQQAVKSTPGATRNLRERHAFGRVNWPGKNWRGTWMLGHSEMDWF